MIFLFLLSLISGYQSHVQLVKAEWYNRIGGIAESGSVVYRVELDFSNDEPPLLLEWHLDGEPIAFQSTTNELIKLVAEKHLSDQSEPGQPKPIQYPEKSPTNSFLIYQYGNKVDTLFIPEFTKVKDQRMQ